MPIIKKTSLGDALVKAGQITPEQLEAAILEQQKHGQKLGRVLVKLGFIKEDQVSKALANQLSLPYVDLKHYSLAADTIALLPETLVRRFRVLPLEDREDGILLGMSDPTDLQAYDAVARLLHRDIQIAVVDDSRVLESIDMMYRRTSEIIGLSKRLESDLSATAVILSDDLTTSGTDEAPVVKLLQKVFEDALQVGASDIHFEPQENKLRIRFRIDGILHPQTEADIRVANALALRLKLMSGLDISEKRLPQDGRFDFSARKKKVDVRLSTMPTQYGESVVLRLLLRGEMLSLERLGMPSAMLARFRQIIHRPNGMVLVTGPTGSGKTTTLYATLSEISTPQNKTITVEDPVEYQLSGINQVQVNEKIELGFARVLRSALRQDPDIVLVGEMRDHETAQIGLRAAMTGHLVLSTLHTNDAVSTPIRLLDMGTPKYMMTTSLQAILAQRLVRLICENCAEPYTPEPREQAWMAIKLGEDPPTPHFRRACGCPHCNGTGYRGRIGVYEMLEFDTPTIDAFSHLDIADFMTSVRKRMTGQTLDYHAALRASQGQTTIAEAMRISNSD